MAFRRKQIVVLSLVLMIVVAGYLQYSYKKSSSSPLSDNSSGKSGDAVYVGNMDKNASAKSKDKSKSKDSTKKKAVTASKAANDFFAQAQLEREITRGKVTDSLKEISEDQNATQEVKAKAYEQMVQISGNLEKEMKIETMVKEKGFDDVFALFADDGSIDIVVKSPNLTSSDVAKITDIVTRQANLDINLDQVHITNKF